MADYFWVGGSGTWDNVSSVNWALSSGGTGGAGVPSSSDTANFDANSGSSAVVTVTASAVSLSTTINKSDITLSLSGSPTLCSAAGTLTLTAGAIVLNNNTLTTGIFSSSNSNSRSVSFGSGDIVLNSSTSSAIILNVDNATFFTCPGTGGFVRSQANIAANLRFGVLGGGSVSNAPNLTVLSGGSMTLSADSYFRNINFAPASSLGGVSAYPAINVCGSLTLSSTTGSFVGLFCTFLASGTITSYGKFLGSIYMYGVGTVVTLADNLELQGTNDFQLFEGTLNLNGYTLTCFKFFASGTGTRAVAFGSGYIKLYRILEIYNATNFTCSGTGGFLISNTNTYTLGFGMSGGATASNAPNLVVNGGSPAITIYAVSTFKNVDFTGSNCTATANAVNIAGNLTLSSGGTFTAFSPTFITSGTITSNSKTLSTTTVNGAGITVTLADALTIGGAGGSTSGLILTQGTFNAAGFNVIAGYFFSSNSNVRSVNMGSGTWTIAYNGSPGTVVWDTATTANLTLTSGASTINFANLNTQIFSGGGLSYFNLNQGGSGALTIRGSNVFNNITNTVQPASFIFTAGTAQTVANFDVAGASGSVVFLNSSVNGSQFTLSKSSGVVNAPYLEIRDSNATGGAVWNALGGVNVSNNTGWNFLPAPATANGNMLFMFV